MKTILSILALCALSVPVFAHGQRQLFVQQQQVCNRQQFVQPVQQYVPVQRVQVQQYVPVQQFRVQQFQQRYVPVQQFRGHAVQRFVQPVRVQQIQRPQVIIQRGGILGRIFGRRTLIVR